MSADQIGARLVREEDKSLLRGQGRYVDDVSVDEARGYVLRSPHAHARLLSVDARRAAAAPGVLVVLIGEDLQARGLGTLHPMFPRKKRDGSPAYVCPASLLAQERVRHVGEAVAFVVAETLDQAKDAAELIDVRYEPLPVIVSAEAALAPGAPALWPDNPGNEAFSHEVGSRQAVEAAFAKAARVVRDIIPTARITANPMEPRGCLAEHDPAQGRYTIRCTTQSVHMTRLELARHIFKQPETKFRVVCDQMGGGFGGRSHCYPEYALALWASEVTGRPVKWIAERSEGLATDDHARGSAVEAELALDHDGRFLGLRARFLSAIGAYFHDELQCIPIVYGSSILTNTYTTAAIHVEVAAVLTNTMTIAPYRGGSRPEPIYVMEMMVDKAAHEMGIDPIELRRRNMIAPSALPYTTPTRHTYDCGDFPSNFALCLAKADYSRVAERRAAARRRGKLLGVGVANAVAPTHGREFEYVEARFDTSGGLTLLCGAMDHGQGHATTFKQILADKLGIEASAIRYCFGDSDLVPAGIGTYGSRSAVFAGSGTLVAAQRIIEKGRHLAAHLFESAVDDVVFESGRFAIAGTDRTIGLAELARKSFDIGNLPKGMEPGLAAPVNFGDNLQGTYPCGAHACEVEIDPDTGQAELVRYWAVDDVGNVLNPLLCDGQIHGGIAQGIGTALLERLVYDESSGQLLSASFQDYAMPRAADLVPYDVSHNPVPTKKNPLGVKGAGEAGTLSAIPAFVAAVHDALAQIGAPRITLPTTSEKIWRAIQAARQPMSI
jgi:aerobic carbon-monoxide dehydrogenase large subunit